jgi:hypothetical protein
MPVAAALARVEWPALEQLSLQDARDVGARFLLEDARRWAPALEKLVWQFFISWICMKGSKCESRRLRVSCSGGGWRADLAAQASETAAADTPICASRSPERRNNALQGPRATAARLWSSASDLGR